MSVYMAAGQREPLQDKSLMGEFQMKKRKEKQKA